MRTPTDWPAYLGSYHQQRAGITEALLRGCTEDPYAWMLQDEDVAGRQVLDLACGSRPLAARLTGARYLGLDASAAELSLSAARGTRSLLQGDAGLLPLADASVDVVLCSMSLQVLTPLAQVLAELARVLRPGGHLLAMVPVGRPLTMADRVHYSRLLLRLHRSRLGAVTPRPVRQLRRSGWSIPSVTSRRFGYRISDADAGQLLVEGFYLPGTDARRLSSATELARSWSGVEIGIPLQRIVAVPPRR